MVSGSEATPRCRTVEEFVGAHAIEEAKLRATIAIVAATDDGDTQAELLRLYPALMNLERQQAAAQNGQALILEHVRAALSGMTPTMVSRFDQPDTSLQGQFEHGGAVLSAQELVNLQHGIQPDLMGADASIYAT